MTGLRAPTGGFAPMVRGPDPLPPDGAVERLSSIVDELRGTPAGSLRRTNGASAQWRSPTASLSIAQTREDGHRRIVGHRAGVACQVSVAEALLAERDRRRPELDDVAAVLAAIAASTPASDEDPIERLARRCAVLLGAEPRERPESIAPNPTTGTPWCRTLVEVRAPTDRTPGHARVVWQSFGSVVAVDEPRPSPALDALLQALPREAYASWRTDQAVVVVEPRTVRLWTSELDPIGALRALADDPLPPDARFLRD